jgi:hypothetical protein
MKKIFVMAASAAMILASCAKDGGEIQTTDGAESRMGLSFTLSKSATTRSDVKGLTTEDAVSKITVFVFDGNGDAVIGSGESFDSPADFEVTMTATTTTYTLRPEKEIKTTAGNRNVYIAANLPSGFTAATEQALKIKMIELADATTPDSFIMFSDAVNKNMVALGEIVGSSPTPGEITAGANRVSASLERIVAKVAVSVEDDGEFTQSLSGLTLTYEANAWDVYNPLNSIYAVKGSKTPSDYDGFKKVAPLKEFTDDAEGETDGDKLVYIAENKPVLFGDLIYSFVRTTVTPSKVAKVVSNAIESVDPASTPLADLWIIRDIDGQFYFCETKSDFDAVGAKLAQTAEGAVGIHFPGSQAFFALSLNHDGSAKKGVINRNEYINVNVTGVTDDVFGAFPGTEASNGLIPEDPTTSGFKKIIPEDPIEVVDAYLTIDVTVAPWSYGTVDVPLQ